MCYKCKEVGYKHYFCPLNNRSRTKPSTSAHKAKAAEQKCKKDDSDSFEGELFSKRHASKAKKEMLWLIDSGASSHMTNNQETLSQFKAMKVPENVVPGDGRTVKAQGSGIVYMKMMFDKTLARKAVLYNVLYVSDLKCNLFSIRAAVANGNLVKFRGDKCWLRDANGVLRGMGTLVGEMYQLNCESLRNNQRALVAVNNEADLWHQRLGHLHEKGLQKCIDKGYLNGSTVTKINSLSFCEGCVTGKFHRKPFAAVGEIRSQRKLELVHSDVCGPMQTASIGTAKYFVTFIDDYTRCCTVFFLKHKSEVFDKFKEFEALTSGGEDEKILVLKTGKSFMKYKSEERIRAERIRTDNGGEYTSSEFEKYLKDKGIRHELTVPDAPEQNGVSEHMNRTLIESTRSMIAHAGLPNMFWAEAISTAGYVRNRVPTRAIKDGRTPYELLFQGFWLCCICAHKGRQEKKVGCESQENALRWIKLEIQRISLV